MFTIGSKVSWQCRNKYRSNPRAQSSFYMYQGTVVCLQPLTAEYTTVRGADDDVVTDQQQFRELNNGKYIAKQETRDDPKGRLYLEALE